MNARNRNLAWRESFCSVGPEPLADGEKKLEVQVRVAVDGPRYAREPVAIGIPLAKAAGASFAPGNPLAPIGPADRGGGGEAVDGHMSRQSLGRSMDAAVAIPDAEAEGRG